VFRFSSFKFQVSVPVWFLTNKEFAALFSNLPDDAIYNRWRHLLLSVDYPNAALFPQTRGGFQFPFAHVEISPPA
jgi:hypothetical protein